MSDQPTLPDDDLPATLGQRPPAPEARLTLPETMHAREGVRSLEEAAAERIGGLPVVGQLGAGGMGEVLKLHDPDLDRTVAAKVIRAGGDGQAVARFLAEARVTGQLQHPNIVPIYALGRRANGSPFFTMQEVRGDDLSTVLEIEAASETPNLRRLLEVFVKVCDAVGYAHSEGVIHRDLKPANVMVGAFGEVLVMDWGLAKRVGERDLDATARALTPSDSGVAETLDGAVLGTPHYMPPEQARGEIEQLDARSDIYSLGAILYQMLTFTAPYEGSTLEVLAAVLERTVTPPRERAPERRIPWELEAIVVKAMARDPEARYPSCAALRADVDAFLDGRLVGAASYSTWAALGKAARRHRAVVAVAAAVVLTAVAGVAWRARGHRQEIERARAAVARHRPDVLRGAVARAWKKGGASLSDKARADAARLIARLSFLARDEEALGRLVDDPAARANRLETQIALGRLAELTANYELATIAYWQAHALGMPRERLDLALAGVDRARGAALTRRRRAISELLDRAGAGELADSEAYREALVRVVGLLDARTVDLLVERLSERTDGMRDATRRVMLESGAKVETPVLRATVERMLARAELAGRGEEAPALTSADRAVLDAIHRALMPPQAAGRRSGRAALIGPLRTAMGRRASDGQLIPLCCEALGLLGDPRAIGPLARYLWLEPDEALAVPAGRALARISVAHPEAGRRLYELVGLGTKERIPHFDPGGDFWRRVKLTLRRIGGGQTLPDRPAADFDLRRRAAQRLFERDQFAEGLAVVDELLAARPDWAVGHSMRGQALAQLGRLAEAEAALDRALSRDPELVNAWANRGITRRRAGKLQAALADLDRAVELAPAAPSIRLARGVCLIALGRLDRAQADFDKALEAGPFPQAQAHRAMVHRLRGRLREARQDMDAARSVEKNNRMIEAEEALLCCAEGNTAGAAQAIERAVRLAPEDPEMRAHRAYVRHFRGDLAGAKADYDFALRSLRIPALYQGRAEIHRLLGRLDQALQDLDRAVALAPDGARWLAARGGLYAQRGDRDLARADLDRAIYVDPNEAQAYFFRAQLNDLEGKPAEALSDARRAARLAPAPRYIGLVARLLVKQGRAEQALTAFDRAIALAPGRVPLRLGRAKLLLRMRRNADALAELTRAVELQPSLVEARLLRSRVFLQSRRLAEAETDIEALTRLEARRSGHWANLSLIRADLNRMAEAEVAMRKAIELAPAAWESLMARGWLAGRQGKRTDAERDLRASLAAAPTRGRPVVIARARALGIALD